MRNPSLAMEVEQVDGQYIVDAHWLEEPIVAATWTEGYWAAMRARFAPKAPAAE